MFLKLLLIDDFYVIDHNRVDFSYHHRDLFRANDKISEDNIAVWLSIERVWIWAEL